jgi:hypothetical protein
MSASAALGATHVLPLREARFDLTLACMTLAPGNSDAPRPSGQYRSFAVTASIGRRMGGWPFARFDIGQQALRVRLPFPWFTTRTAPIGTVTAVTVATAFDGTTRFVVEDSQKALSDVRIALPFRGERVIAELRRNGYDVRDSRSATALLRMPWTRRLGGKPGSGTVRPAAPSVVRCDQYSASTASRLMLALSWRRRRGDTAHPHLPHTAFG